LEVFTSYHNILSPLGFNSRDNFKALLNDQLGVKQIQYGKTNETFCLSVIGDVLIDESFSRLNDPGKFTKLEKASILSIQDTLEQSGVSLQDKRTLLIYSTTKGNIDLLEGKNHFPKERVYLPVMLKQIATYFKAANEPLLLSNACISGLLAIIIAKRFIQSGTYDTVVVCGGDLVSEFTVSGFKSFNALSPHPCKPFDARREGINLGEAVATLIVTNNKALKCESAMHILNGASANDANHISGPSRTGEGLLAAITMTLKNFPEIKIDTINAHGTATPYNDEMESIAFERAGLSEVPLNSLKGYYGHTLGAAGVLETIIAIESAINGQLIKSAGFDTIGVSGKIQVIEKHQAKKIDTVLKTASGFGGCNGAMLLTKY
jgi:3-oxoacyl-[acyl-carrier-protein] synthase-1